MDRIPVEVWEMIFGQLSCPMDYHSTYAASAVWRNYLGPSRQVWMFGKVFPYLLPYLSKHEALTCRAVCKQWNNQLDDFLENNAFQRPVIYDEASGTQMYHSDHHTHLNLSRTLQMNNMDYLCSLKTHRMNRMITAVRNRPRCPFVGRSATISITPRWQMTTKKCFRVLGPHIWFLNIVVTDLTASVAWNYIEDLLKLVPNLRKLQVGGNLSGPLPNMYSYQCQFMEEVNFDLHIECRLPMLETLHLNLDVADHSNVNEFLFSSYVSEKLTSLSLNYMPAISYLNHGNILDLSLELNSESALQELLKLDKSLQRLALTLTGPVNAANVFLLVQKYRQTLKYFELKVTALFYDSVGTNHDVWKPFSSLDVMQESPCLKTLTLETCCPISLNFLCGLKRNVEYLHILTDNMGHWDTTPGFAANASRAAEELDFLYHLRQLPLGDSKGIYHSNVWRVFPKLKLLTVQWRRGFEGQRYMLHYKRDAMERMNHGPV